MKNMSIIGAGPVGCLLTVLLSRKGYAIDIFERRPDIRSTAIAAGRSINLALSTRGIHALEQCGIASEILNQAVPMYGRTLHGIKGELAFQRYGMDNSQYINSISRAELNRALLSKAEQSPNVKIHFEKRLKSLDFKSSTLHLWDEKHQTDLNHKISTVIGSDGSASALRASMAEHVDMELSEETLNYAYKELTIPAGPNSSFLIEKNSLHIWPRGNFMLIALPNFDGSFTCTAFLPEQGAEGSFESLKNPQDVRNFFNKYFADAASLIENLEESFLCNPTGHMVTVRAKPWHVGSQALLIGDAAHALVPFFGQGLNCGFEDCTLLNQILDKYPLDEAFAEFERTRHVDANAIATLALENFIEMRDRVAQPRFLLEKEIEKILMKEFAGIYISRYALVTFSRKPYQLALQVSTLQDQILSQLSESLISAQDFDRAKAKHLIETHLAPLMQNT